MKHPLRFGPVLLAAGALAYLPAQAATQIGVTSAVVPAARGTPPEAEARVLQVGLDMQANERVQTDAGGKAQLLFLDGSALSIGPNSEVVLDEYVYDPASRSGKIALSATRGVFRLVGGAISKTDPVLLRTPTATIGVRGGIAMASVGATTSAAFLFGAEMTVEGSAGQRQSANRPGFEITTNPNGTVNPPQPLSQQTLAGLSAMEGGSDGEPGGGPAVSDDDVASSQVSALNSATGLSDVAPAAGGSGGLATTAPTGEVAEASRQQTREEAASQPPPSDAPAGPQAPVVEAPVVPPAPPPAGLTLAGTFLGRAKHEHPGGPSVGTHDQSLTQNVALQDGAVAGGVFSASVGISPAFSANIADGAFAATATQQPFGPVQAMGGGFLTPERDFVLYTLIDQGDGHRILAYAGLPTPAEAIPTNGVWSYQLLDDFVRSQTLPFIEDPSGGAALPQAYIAWDASAPGAIRAFGSGAIVINGQGSAQQSAGVVLTGETRMDGFGPFILGRALGQRRTGASGAGDPTILYSAPLATGDAAGDADFFGLGGPRNFVLEATQVGLNDETIGRGGMRFANAGDNAATTYFPNTPAIFGAPMAPAPRTTRTLNGFAAATETRYDSSGLFVGTQSLRSFGFDEEYDGVEIMTDAAQNRVSAFFRLSANQDEASVEVLFGGGASLGGEAFIDDRTFMAQTNGEVEVNGDPVSGLLGMVTSSALQHQGLLPDGVAFCDCTYLTWGFFFGRRERSDFTPDNRVVELGAWVAGEASSVSQMVGIAPQSATYSGHVIAGVNNNGALYTAVGGMQLNFTFGAGNFGLNSVNITNFDGTNLAGVNTAGPEFGSNAFNNFSFGISGVHPTAGALNADIRGSFFGPGAPPVNAAGKITIINDSNDYEANGTFATQRPPS